MKKYLLSLICCIAALSASAVNYQLGQGGWIIPGSEVIIFTSQEPDATSSADIYQQGLDEGIVMGYQSGESVCVSRFEATIDSMQAVISTKEDVITNQAKQISDANAAVEHWKGQYLVQSNKNTELQGQINSALDYTITLEGQISALNKALDSVKYNLTAYEEFVQLADSSYNALENKYDSVSARYVWLEESFKANEMIIYQQDSTIEALKFEVKKAGYVQTYLMIADSVAIIVNGERINTAPDINYELYEVTMEDSQALEDANFGASNAAFTFLADSITAGATEVTIKVFKDCKGMIDSTVFPMNFIIDRPIKDGSWVFVDLIAGTLAIDKKDVPDQPVPPVTPEDPVTPDVPEAPKNPFLAQGHKLLTSDMVDVLPSKPEVHLSIPEISEDWYYDKAANTFSYYAPDWFNERTEKTVGDTLYFHMSIFKDASNWDEYTNEVIINSVGNGPGKYVIDLATMTCNFVPFSETRYYAVRVFNDDMSAGTPVTDDYIIETKWESQYSNVGYKIVDADAYTEIIEKAYQKFKYINIQLQQVDDNWESPVSGLIPATSTTTKVHPSNNFCR